MQTSANHIKAAGYQSVANIYITSSYVLVDSCGAEQSQLHETLISKLN